MLTGTPMSSKSLMAGYKAVIPNTKCQRQRQPKPPLAAIQFNANILLAKSMSALFRFVQVAQLEA